MAKEGGSNSSMHMSSTPSGHSWQPVTTAKTNTITYWLNLRFLVCALWILSSLTIATILLWKHEEPRRGAGQEESRQEATGALYGDEAWRPCLKEIHPAWLLLYRAIAFIVLAASLIVSVVVQGAQMFFFYTQWTFALVTIYFGIGFLLSTYGCYKFINKVEDSRPICTRLDAEDGTYTIPTNNEHSSACDTIERNDCQDEHSDVAGFWSFIFQIIYQINAGAVMLTDCVFWLIIVPFLAIKDYNLNVFMICMHSVNAIFLLGDTALNSLRFPWFRISYFLIWTAVYVIFQWVVHAFVSIWWPYPFLDLSSSYAPLWYFLVAVMHVPCYAIFSQIIKTKHALFSRMFPHSYLCVR